MDLSVTSSITTRADDDDGVSDPFLPSVATDAESTRRVVLSPQEQELLRIPQIDTTNHFLVIAIDDANNMYVYQRLGHKHTKFPCPVCTMEIPVDDYQRDVKAFTQIQEHLLSSHCITAHLVRNQTPFHFWCPVCEGWVASTKHESRHGSRKET